MKKSILFWQFTGVVATGIGGTLLHFLYELCGKNAFVAMFSGVNESTWEHMKLLFFPTFIFALIEYRLLGTRKDFWCVKLIGIITGLLLIPVLFYTLNGIFGKTPDWINILIFYIAVIALYILETYIFKKKHFDCHHPRLAFIIICLIGAIFVLFTFFTPQIPIFKDPLSGSYGHKI